MTTWCQSVLGSLAYASILLALRFVALSLSLTQKLTEYIWNISEREFSSALQLLDYDIVLINNHLETPGHHLLINAAPLLQSPDSQTSRVKSEPKTVYLSLIGDRE